MSTKTLHLIANAHLDPVWLWDWREGLNEGLITCRAVLDLMDERPELTFMRGESLIYEHIETAAPDLFERIKQYVKEGRWELVGGTFIQPDNNVPATETLIRHFTRGQNFFRTRFGRTPKILWAADSFGHPEGLPDIIAAAGMSGFAFTRPENTPYRGPFWWIGPGGSRILAYRPLGGWYGTEHEEVPRRLDSLLELSAKYEPANIGAFFGLGNHGGGPTRRQLEHVDEWRAKHPEVRVVFSTLHGLFGALREEVRAKGENFFPTHSGDLQHFARGCYSSIAKQKFAFHSIESGVCRAERATTAIAVLEAPSGALRTLPAIAKGWDAALFNTFHDILPGSSIERAVDEQIEWMAGARHDVRSTEFAAINRLANLVDTSVRPAEGYAPTGASVLVFNPHPYPVATPIQIEANIDYRQVYAYAGRNSELPYELIGPEGLPVPCQRIRVESLVMQDPPWRIRVSAAPLLPALGWSVFELAYREGAQKPVIPAADLVSSPEEGVIQSRRYRIEAKAGDHGISIQRDGVALLDGAGLGAVTVEDPYGSWGDMESDDPVRNALTNVRFGWSVERVKVLEDGPLHASLWVRLTGGHSVLDLTLSLTGGRDAVDVTARLLWNERAARIKLVMPVSAGAPLEALYDRAGGATTCTQVGEEPGGRWVKVKSPQNAIAFASDGLSSFSTHDGVFYATVARASRYAAGNLGGADTGAGDPEAEVWNPAVDRGELKFRFLVTGNAAPIEQLSQVIAEPILVQTVLARKGRLARSGTLGAIEPSDVRLLAYKPAEDGLGVVVRVHNQTECAKSVSFTMPAGKVVLGDVPKGGIATWRVTNGSEGLKAEAADATA
ncbi:MAG: hypothetical protein P4L33_15230 [Capsulimonadaceae bacterium]|nr:hypothetical protein [Capsulimonadaceae bacterium]